MSFSSIGDLSSSLALRAINNDLKVRQARLSSELASGRVSDLAAQSGGDFGPLGASERWLAMAETYRFTAQEIALRGQALQAALEVVGNQVGEVAGQVLTAGKSGLRPQIDLAGKAALAGFASVVSALNTRLEGRSLFAGDATRDNAVIPARAILDDLQSRVSGAMDKGQVEQIVKSYFQDPAGGFEATGYQGSPLAGGQTRISENTVVSFDVTALSPEIRDALEGLALASLTTRDVPALNSLTARRDVLLQSSNILLKAGDGITARRAEIGTVQARIDVVQARNAARKTAVETARNALLSADPYETATRLQGIENNLQALYLVTSRLSRMSLVRFLR